MGKMMRFCPPIRWREAVCPRPGSGTRPGSRLQAEKDLTKSDRRAGSAARPLEGRVARWIGLAALMAAMGAAPQAGAATRPGGGATAAGPALSAPRGVVVTPYSTRRDLAQALSRAAEGEPVLAGYRIVRPQGAARDGDWVEFLTFWAGADTVWADFRELDPGAPGAEPAIYRGDSALVVGDTLHLWACYGSLHQIAPDNPRLDGAAIPVPVTALSTEGDTTRSEAITFCLSNDPPRHIATLIDAPPERFFVDGGDTVLLTRNGELLHLETTWHYALTGFFVTADFSAADDSFSAARVIYEPVAQVADSVQTHGIYYELDERAQREDSLRVPVQIVAEDGGCGRATHSFLIEIDNRGPLESPIFRGLPESVMESELVVHGRAPAGSEDVLIVLNHVTESLAQAQHWGDSLLFADTVSLAGGVNHLVAYGRDRLGNLSPPSAEGFVDLTTAPQFKRWWVLRPEVVALDSVVAVTVVDGDVVQVRSYWDSRSDYNLSADFSEVDDQFFPDSVAYTRCENLEVPVGDTTETWACYQFEYRISPENTLEDGSALIVPVTAHDPGTGYSATTQTLQFCLLNEPPVHLRTWPVWNSVIYSERDGDSLVVVRNGQQIRLHTSWRSRNRPLGLRADFSLLDAHTRFPVYAFVDSLSSDSVGTYSIAYGVSDEACCEEGVEPYPLPVTIQVTDRACGSASAVLWFEFDNEGPAAAPTLDAAPPAAVSATRLAVSGRLPAGAVDAVLSMFHVEADSTTEVLVAADTLGRFSGEVPLLSGENRLTVYGRDAIGNRSPASTVHKVWRTTQATLEIPKPFHPGDQFLLEQPAGWSSIELALYNLEGDLIRLWRGEGPLVHFQAPWDGRNGRGEMVKSGPYLLRIRTSGPAGQAAEEVKAIVFQR